MLCVRNVTKFAGPLRLAAPLTARVEVAGGSQRKPASMSARYDRSTTISSGARVAMRIAYMLTSLGMGGAERQVVALAERMAGRGHTVALIVLMPRVAQEWPTALDVVHLEMRKTPVSVFRGLMRARRFLREFRPDLVHSHTYPGNMAARMLRLVGATPAVVSTIHNVYEGGWGRMLAYRLTDGLSLRTTAVSQAAAERYVRIKAVPKNKCVALANAIDIVEFEPAAERRAATRDQLGAAEAFLWLAVGRIVPAKDFPNLLRAFAQVRRAFPEAQLWIAGEAAATVANRVGAFAVEHGEMDGVRWLGLRRDMPALFDAADAFVLASAWEGMPLALGEAMAMEMPAVATDVGGVRELVGSSGAIVPAKDPSALADAMLALMRMPPEARHAQGRAARQRIAENFSIDALADRWEEFYGSVLAFRSRPVSRTFA